VTPLVSVVVPTRNEAADIGATLDALVKLDWGPLEILVVDASRDETPAIVRGYPSPPVRLIPQSRGRGRAAARNEGLLAARGEIVVILNADVLLPPDFVRRIVPHYAAGADYVLVESRVRNTEALPARYLQAMHEWRYPPRPRVEAAMQWTEGFSCRRAAAVAVGLLPEGVPLPLVAGEDGWFGDKLAAAGCRKVFDRSIVVEHVAPARLGAFWRQQVGRGQGWPQVLHGRHGWRWSRVAWTIARVVAGTALGLVVPVGALRRGWALSARSPRGRRDFLPLATADWLASAAVAAGAAGATVALRRAGAR
jgi:glycosyltransferase involved in cell wall biosynthesis